jgi:nucleoside-diphosphate-sugar epimerase
MLSNGKEKRQFIYLEDVCETIYNLKNNWISIKDVANIIQKTTLKEGIKKMIKKNE